MRTQTVLTVLNSYALMLGSQPRWHDDSEVAWLMIVGVPLDEWMRADTPNKFRLLLLKRRLGKWKDHVATEIFKQGTANYWVSNDL